MGAGVSHVHDRYFRAVMQGREEQVALVSAMQRYQSRIWDRYLREHPGATTVPAILPAVIYQGSRRWTAATDLRDVLDLDDETGAVLAEYLPRLPYRLDDLTQVDVDVLRGRVSTPPLLLMWLMFKLAPASLDVLALLDSLCDDFSEVAAGRSAPRDLTTAFTYIVNVSDVPAGRLRPFAARLGPVVEEALMTTAEMLRAEGRVQGQAEGRVQGQAELVLEQLAAKFGPLGADVQARVRAASGSQLHTWGMRILTATSLAEVLD